MPTTTPPTITPVSEIRSRIEVGEGDDVGYMEGMGGYVEGATIMSLVAITGWVVAGEKAGEKEVGFKFTIDWPGTISGWSKTHRCEAAERETEKGTHTTDE
jgi:hypothetical protein